MLPLITLGHKEILFWVVKHPEYGIIYKCELEIDARYLRFFLMRDIQYEMATWEEIKKLRAMKAKILKTLKKQMPGEVIILGNEFEIEPTYSYIYINHSKDNEGKHEYFRR